MKTINRTVASLGLAVTLGAGLGAAGVAIALRDAAAQAPSGLKRTLLQKVDVPGGEGRDAILALVELQPGVEGGRHSHFGEEIGFVIEGEGRIDFDGKPSLALKAGDSYHIPAGTVHNPKVTGAGPQKVLAVFIVEKGKPLATPAP